MQRISQTTVEDLGQNTSIFTRAANAVAHSVGSSYAFMLAFSIVLVWALLGPLFQYSDTWQLVINTGTTIVTFLMVFLIQNTQNRDAAAMHIKLDEIIRSLDGAHNALLDLEELTQEELEAMRKRYILLARAARKELREGGNDLGHPEC